MPKVVTLSFPSGLPHTLLLHGEFHGVEPCRFCNGIAITPSCQPGPHHPDRRHFEPRHRTELSGLIEKLIFCCTKRGLPDRKSAPEAECFNFVAGTTFLGPREDRDGERNCGQAWQYACGGRAGNGWSSRICG
jgi:hypothetical protein